MAYSFQYLSFKEVSAITPVCCYFTYLVHTFPALCHYDIHLNRNFFISAMRNRVHLKHLSHFKSIHISAAYFDTPTSWKDVTKRRWIIFKHILYRVVHQSVSSLRTLKIDIENGYGNMYGSSRSTVRNVLLMVLKKHDVLHIKNLQWFSDYFLPATETSFILNEINDNIRRKLPHLEHFVCGINKLRCRYDNQAFNISSIARCIASTVNHYKHLKTLHLKCTEWNIYRHNTNLIDLIAQQLTKLEELTIISCIVPNDTSFELRNKFKHKSLHKLKTEFICNSNNGEGFGETIHHILRALFNVFGDIRTFSFGLFFKDSNIPPPSLEFTMDWRFLFGQLKQMRHLQITSISYGDAITIVNQFDGTLVTLDMCVVFKRYYDFLWSRSTSTVSQVITKFGVFMAQYLLPFVKRHKNDVTAALKHLKISFGKPPMRHTLTDEMSSNWWAREAEPILESDISSFYDPLLELLCNIPSSLQSLDLCLPLSKHYCHSHTTKIVQKISEISAQRKLKNLESIRLENFKLKGDAKSFLDFFFGFENNIHREKQKLYLSFV
eukprot:815715_1